MRTTFCLTQVTMRTPTLRHAFVPNFGLPASRADEASHVRTAHATLLE
jgi:hypothetical protein